MTRSELEDAAAYQSPEAECDVVMKGGITSGVVYPWAVCELARTYRLRSVGGTSAGAIAAAASAAAEVGRGSGVGGFARLAGLPRFFAGSKNLLRLFQPRPSLAWLFRILESLLRGGGLVSLTWALARGGLGPGWLWLLALVPGLPGLLLGALAALRVSRGELWGLLGLSGLAILLGVVAALDVGTAWWRGRRLAAFRAGLSSSLLLATTVALLRRHGLADVAAMLGAWSVLAAGACAGIVLGGVWRALRLLPSSHYGICSGGVGAGRKASSQPSQRRPPGPGHPLTHWLSDEIDGLAGREVEEGPLTFGALEEHEVELRMLTTNLTHQRPYRLPFQEDVSFNSGAYFFDPEQFRELFPEPVVKWMIHHPPPVAEEPSRDEREWLVLCELLKPLRPLPAAADLPVIVATRLSLSFPVLLSAVPLWAVDWSRAANQLARAGWRDWLAGLDVDPRDAADEIAAAAPSTRRPRAQVCWFSDGGICSNFPVHFFDKPLPTRPTFAINLRSPHPDHPLSESCEEENVWLPTRSSAGHHLLWEEFDGLPGFVGAILATMQSWGDNAQMRLHGFWDRVAHVNLEPGEGGLNLDMPGELILRLAERGRQGGLKLRERFASGNAPDPEPSWPGHRWLRYRSTMALLEQLLEELQMAYEREDPTRAGYPALSRRGDGPPSGYRWARRAQAEFGDGAIGQLLGLVREWQASPESFAEGAPRPRPELRTTPRV